MSIIPSKTAPNAHGHTVEIWKSHDTIYVDTLNERDVVMASAEFDLNNRAGAVEEFERTAKTQAFFTPTVVRALASWSA